MSAANDLGPEPAGLLGAVAQRIFGARGRAERAPNDADLGRFAGEVVGVTGAGGSVGARLVAALLAASPATRVVAFDQDDTALQRVARAVDSPRLLPWLGNVRDPRAVGSAFAAHRPQLVVHCAAVKHSD
ncbi:MAG: polysaccharide biosynthesis protein, partial [Planctomycetes bacterium]|nr:polysaccharide biosynthesis protein [Planctomycetota bacterium]